MNPPGGLPFEPSSLPILGGIDPGLPDPSAIWPGMPPGGLPYGPPSLPIPGGIDPGLPDPSAPWPGMPPGGLPYGPPSLPIPGGIDPSAPWPGMPPGGLPYGPPSLPIPGGIDPGLPDPSDPWPSIPIPGGPSPLPIPGGIDPGLPNASGDLATLRAVETTPSDGAVLTEPPTVLSVKFNQPFAPYSVSQDIGLVRVDANGNVLENLTGWLRTALNLTTDPSVLPSTIQGKLAPGRYQILILGRTSQLSGLDTPSGAGAPLINRGTDQVVSTFTIGSQKPAGETPQTLADATDLGTVGPIPIATSASLDLGFHVGNYQLYKVTLAAGHFWRLGAEVTAQRDGGTLNSVLSLFDANGRVLKSADVGLPDAPFDPYFFVGLEPGTYYLGVSSVRNRPDAPGGYDPVNGVFGASGSSQADGSYTLHVVASVADTPTSLLDSQLIYSDPLDPRPTGIVVVFSGPMDLNSFASSVDSKGNVTFAGLELVDESGRVWSLIPTSFKGSNSQYSFLFSDPLPQGKYSLRVPTSGSVTDLTGRAPVAKGSGRDTRNGVLASWTVKSHARTQDANDLGTILRDASAAVTRANLLAAGSTATYRFVVPADGYYTLETTASSESFLIQMVGSDLTTTIQSGGRNGLNSSTVFLTSGIYSLKYKATGPGPVKLSLALFRKQVAPEAILDNGVGQGPALNLALITPIPLNPTGQGGMPSEPTGLPLGPEPASPSPLAPTTPVPGVPVQSTTSHSLIASADNGLVLTLGSGLIGSPIAGAEHVAAVGPGTLTGTTALAANTPGVLQGILYGPSLGRTTPNLSGESLLTSSDVTGESGEPLASTVGALITPEPPTVPSPNERVIASPSEWLSGFGTMLLHGLGLASSSPTSMELEAAPSEPIERIVLSRDDLVTPATEEQVEHASMAAPLGVSLVSILALRLQHPVRRWVEQARGERTKRRSAGHGPHKRA
ncbi:hypothetical protein V5E97_39820 [Singulisphaera sp. Ch08]|uniref:Peptidase C-terminal archaeal/bacterial domain-containing protein n=1 Tax=Singulisphaera sp. Ch08 TaxID=3120278 RepID=A0AAU7CH33_9BACT